MMRSILTAAAATFALVGAGAALAQPAEGGPPPGGGNPAFAAVRAACQADGDKLCPGKERRERFQCMRENSDKLSPGCKDAMSKLPQRPGPGGSR